MIHQKKGRKFGRKKGQRNMFMKGLVTQLILREKIKTTDARAKEMRPEVEKLVTMAKKQTLASLRLLIARTSQESALKLFYDIAPRYAQRNGGYLRITKTSKRRVGDGAPESIIQFV